MAYALIANVPPVYGLYSSFFPALFYTILGTSRHCAFGTFSIVSGLLTGNIVIQVMSQLGKNMTNTVITAHPIYDSHFDGLANIEIANMVAFIIGVYILGFGILQLGFISNFMSEELLSGFMTSASIIVFETQIGNLLGISLSHFSGPLNLPYAVIEIFERLKETNIPTLIITIICVIILSFFKLVVNRFTSKTRIKTPFPIELFVVIGGTIASHYMHLSGPKYKVKIVGTIGNKYLIIQTLFDINLYSICLYIDFQHPCAHWLSYFP